MPAYMVFTRLRTRNPEEVKLYAEQAPKSLAGHTIRFLAQFGRFEVREGGVSRVLQSWNSAASPRQRLGTRALRIKTRASISTKARITVSSSWRECSPKSRHPPSRR